jgi:hypothetical protein
MALFRTAIMSCCLAEMRVTGNGQGCKTPGQMADFVHLRAANEVRNIWQRGAQC